VALTFDDGPGDATPAVVDALADLRLPATFFLIGQQVPERAELVRRMAGAGHELGVHAWEHPDLSVDLARAEMELDRTVDVLRDTTGVTPRLFRPPLGAWTRELLAMARLRDLETVLWDVNPHDYAGGEATAQTIVDDVLETVGRGSIVLLHDGGPADSRAELLRALPPIAEGLRERGLAPVTVSELVA
jgi:peptidoglycan-N-acetylglucosamine deacetylase